MCELRSGITAAGVTLADHKVGCVVVLNSSLSLTIGNGGARNIREIDEESFVRLDQQVAVNSHVEPIGLQTCGNGLAGEAAAQVIDIINRRAVLCGNVEGDPAGGCRY